MFSRSRLLLAAIVVVALVVRIGFLLADPHPFADSGLAADSAEVARQIDEHGRWFESNLTALTQLGDAQDSRRRLLDPASLDFRSADAHPKFQPEALQPPGEAVILATLWKLTGSERWLPYQLLTIVVDSLMITVVFYIGLMLFARRRTAFIGALLYAVFPPIAWLTTVPHLDFWAVDFTLVITAFLLRARNSERPSPSLICAGVAIGLGSYFRPGLLLIAPFVGLAVLSRRRWQASLRLASVPTVIAILLLVPWTVRNYDVFHRLIPVRIGSGQALWEGLGELPNNLGAKLNDAATYRQVHAVRPSLVYGSPAYDSLLMSWGTRAVRQHPGFYLRLMTTRLFDATILLHNTDWTGAGPPPSASGALEPILFLIAFVTVLMTRRRYTRSHAVLVAVVVATILPYLFLHFEPRYVLPASFAYLLWTGLAADLLIERLTPHAVGASPASSLETDGASVPDGIANLALG